MEALKRKWNSCRGASILLALLFMLVCIMAGTSVLMAAASNAGKIRSNKEEQQKYLTLSSALQLLCDELASVEYVGQFTYIVGEPEEVEPPDGSIEGYDYLQSQNSYMQTSGCFMARRDINGNKLTQNLDDLKKILPLFDNMDYFFADEIIRNYSDRTEVNRDDDNRIVTTTVTTYTTLANNKNLTPEDALAEYKKVSLDTTYKLTFTIDGGAAGDNYGFTDNVTITVSSSRDGRIYLNAVLGDDENLKMRATLKPANNFDVLDLEVSDDRYDEVSKEYYTKSVTWELEEIVKVW